jgi:predicted DNA-binding ribbon-helix-helix protein
MLMATLTRRLQVLIEESRFTELEHIAQERHTTVAALVREALDRTYARPELTHREASTRLLDRAPIDVGEWDQVKREIEESLVRDRHE